MLYFSIIITQLMSLIKRSHKVTFNILNIFVVEVVILKPKIKILTK